MQNFGIGKTKQFYFLEKFKVTYLIFFSNTGFHHQTDHLRYELRPTNYDYN